MGDDRAWNEGAELEVIAKIAREAHLWNGVEFFRACPPSVIDRCWAALDGEGWDENAANILLDHGRTLWSAGEINGALELKRLFENAFRKGSEFAKTVMFDLAGRARTDFKRKAVKRGLTAEAINGNVMAAVEECYFQDKHDAESNFTGACVLLLYRSTYRDAEPTGFAAAMCGAREAFGFYGAGQIEAARETWAYAGPILEALEPDTDREQVAAAAMFVFGLGVGAKTAGDLEMHEKLMHLAGRLFERKGNDYATSLYYLSEIAAQAGKPAEQLRLLKQALDVPDVDDEELLRIARMGVSTCRAELEGNIELLDLAGPNTEGIPSELAQLSKEFAAKMMSGANPSPEEERRYATALIDWSTYCESHGDAAGAFWAAVMLLRVGLSHGQSSGFPMSYREILNLAEKHEADGNAEDRVQYESLKSVAEAAIESERPKLTTGESSRVGGLAQKLREIRSGK